MLWVLCSFFASFYSNLTIAEAGFWYNADVGGDGACDEGKDAGK